MKANMIAVCGMNCSVCSAHLREKNKCYGCRSKGELPTYCLRCIMRNCDQFLDGKKKFCYECENFPCKRLKQLDKRYRDKYHMSMIENLEMIRDNGIENFLSTEVEKWKCRKCGGIVCVHKNKCQKCGQEKFEV